MITPFGLTGGSQFNSTPFSISLVILSRRGGLGTEYRYMIRVWATDGGGVSQPIEKTVKTEDDSDFNVKL